MELLNKFSSVGQKLHDKPMAVSPLVSYRYRSRYGWIMIGACSDLDALCEAERSIKGKAQKSHLQVWNGTVYVDVLPAMGAVNAQSRPIPALAQAAALSAL